MTMNTQGQFHHKGFQECDAILKLKRFNNCHTDCIGTYVQTL